MGHFWNGKIGHETRRSKWNIQCKMSSLVQFRDVLNQAVEGESKNSSGQPIFKNLQIRDNYLIFNFLRKFPILRNALQSWGEKNSFSSRQIPPTNSFVTLYQTERWTSMKLQTYACQLESSDYLRGLGSLNILLTRSIGRNQAAFVPSFFKHLEHYSGLDLTQQQKRHFLFQEECQVRIRLYCWSSSNRQE